MSDWTRSTEEYLGEISHYLERIAEAMGEPPDTPAAETAFDWIPEIDQELEVTFKTGQVVTYVKKERLAAVEAELAELCERVERMRKVAAGWKSVGDVVASSLMKTAGDLVLSTLGAPS